jgi:DNA-binding NtrC family response regulator
MKKILIVYEDDLWARSLSADFNAAGFKIEMTGLLSDMIRKVRTGDFAVVLLDDEIEGIKACDVVSLLKKIDWRLQVIVVSSVESLEVVRRLRGEGIFYQAMKPVDVDEIRSAVQCAFGKIERERLREYPVPDLVHEMTTM